ncbi:MAG TPA: PilZ domain-containing protein [Xanthobacteraceae bacterium]|jgi:hypothetical protein|nr:PilZ domain-containing protein [Xanthobacteraceae bacterium]
MVVVGNFRNGAELRKKPRRTFRHAATIVHGDEPTIQTCSVIDISEGGARLQVEEEIELPESFMLSLTPSGKVRRFCRLVWRDGTTLGVTFTDLIDDADA